MPPPRPSDDGDPIGTQTALDPVAGPPAPPRRRRIRMLIDVVDHPDEVAYVTGLFEERAWAVRPAEPDEAAPAVPHRIALVIEVRLHGARLGALRTAIVEVERLARQAELGAWVRDAVLVEHPRPARTSYSVHRLLAPWARPWTWLGGADERVVTVPAGPRSREDARTELDARTMGGRPFNAESHGLRVPGYSEANPPLDETPQERRTRWTWKAAGAVGLVFAIVCGMWAVWADGPWKLIPALLSPAGAVPLGRTLKETRDRSRRAQWVAGASGTTALALFGALVGQDTRPRDLWVGLLVLTVTTVTGTGVVLALRRTFFTRHAAWLVPLSVPVAWSLVAWLGSQMHDEYLDRFDIRADTVPMPALGRYLAAAEPMAFALGSVLFFVAILGWLRHFHWGRDGGLRLFGIVMATLLAIAYTLAAIALGADQANRAAGKAAEATARTGTEPPGYFGLKGRLVCVRPVSQDGPLPVENGPAPVGHPVLSFGTTGDWIWLWDPARADGRIQESFAVRLEDVQLIPAENRATGRCPAP
ncbi:hypothetical protein [Streptomyces chartreusis]|uniref:hypothetical protein n=1 Tax=Streptomyces chartreusis TaxID=1969 RepID=UPI0034170E61